MVVMHSWHQVSALVLSDNSSLFAGFHLVNHKLIMSDSHRGTAICGLYSHIAALFVLPSVDHATEHDNIDDLWFPT